MDLERAARLCFAADYAGGRAKFLDACRTLGTDDLSGTTLYTTVEPCPMCAGALLNAKVGHWVLGLRFKTVGRNFGRYSVETFAEFVGADIKFTTGVLEEECLALRSRYFARK